MGAKTLKWKPKMAAILEVGKKRRDTFQLALLLFSSTATGSDSKRSISDLQNYSRKKIEFQASQFSLSFTHTTSTDIHKSFLQLRFYIPSTIFQFRTTSCLPSRTLTRVPIFRNGFKTFHHTERKIHVQPNPTPVK